MATVSVNLTPPVTTGNPEWDAIVGPADTWVRDVLGRDATEIDIRWAATPGRYGQPLTFLLTLSGEGCSADEVLTTEAMADRRGVRLTALRAWRHLLDAQTRDGYNNLIRGLGELAEGMRDGE